MNEDTKTSINIRFQNTDQMVKFVEANGHSGCNVDVCSMHSVVDGSSILGVLSLDRTHPMKANIYGDHEKIDHLKEMYRLFGVINE